MRILIVCYHPPDKGGLAINTHIIAQGLKKFGHYVVMASTENYPGIKTFVFGRYRKNPIFVLNNFYLKHFLSKIVKREKIDIIHAQDRLTSIAAISASKKEKIPCVIHFHDYWFACPKGNLLRYDLSECSGVNFFHCCRCMLGKRFLWEFYKFFFLVKTSWKKLEKADVKIAVSKCVMEKLSRYGIQTNVRVLHNPVTDIFFKDMDESRKNQVKRKYNLKKNVVSYFGEFSLNKGIFLLCDVIKELHKDKRITETSFLVIGWGKLEKYIISFIKKNNLSNVVFLPRVNPHKIRNFYAISNIIVIPSIWPDPLPRVAEEALSMGIPVISSNIGGLKDLVENNKTGFLIIPGDKRKLKDSIVNLTLNPLLRHKFSENAKQNAVGRFNKDIIVRALIKIYQDCLKGTKK